MGAISGTLSPTRVQEQLDEILASPFFRTSNRCSRMLRYIVEQFILDPSVRLKERTIGASVFMRSPDYDTSNDPIVRCTAGEIRKRLAQYYADQTAAGVHIALPAGSYFPVISAGWQGEDSSVALKPNLLTARKISFLRRGWLVILLLSVGLMGAVGVRSHIRAGPVEQFWRPLRVAGLPPIICLGDTARVLLTKGIDGGGEESKPGINPNNRMALSDVLALNSFVSFLAPLTGKPDVRNSATTSFADLQRQPAILIGGRTNQWTMRAMKFLPFQLKQGKDSGVVEIIDSQNASTPPWQVDFRLPASQIPKEYAIIARFIDPVTNRPTIVAAVLEPTGRLPEPSV